MPSFVLTGKADTYLEKLCKNNSGRPVGSRANNAALEYISEKLESVGCKIEKQLFDCITWQSSGVELSIDGLTINAFASPFSLSCDVNASLVIVTSINELEQIDIKDKIVLLCGDIAKEQFIPKNFPFYNPADQKCIIELLETKNPLALVTSAPRKFDLEDSQYLIPLFEDGDFNIPSAYISELDTIRMIESNNEKVHLKISSARIPSKGYNIIGKRGNGSEKRIILLAHIDTKFGTPGATDNACGIVVLLLLAELLGNYEGKFSIEFTIMNGEECYSSPGEMKFLTENKNTLDNILLGINLDGLGYSSSDTAYSMYGCPSEIADAIQTVFSSYHGLVMGDPWYQSDHGLLIQNNIPALAITSAHMIKLMNEIYHSPKDKPEIVDTSKLVKLAYSLRDLILYLDRHYKNNC
ncbi:MAG: M28 family peptidase [Bacteroidota bacterium]|nr:M28 family peptidase [Bacteroidota bacterium]